MKQPFEIIDILPHTNTYGVKVVIKIGHQSYYLVDKADIFDVGWETMIFECDKEGNVSNWLELYTDRTNKPILDCITEFVKELFLKAYLK